MKHSVSTQVQPGAVSQHTSNCPKVTREGGQRAETARAWWKVIFRVKVTASVP